MGCGSFIPVKKLSMLKGNIRKWMKFNFGSIKLRKLALLQELGEVDIAKETRSLSSSKLQQKLELVENLVEIRNQKEI